MANKAWHEQRNEGILVIYFVQGIDMSLKGKVDSYSKVL